MYRLQEERLELGEFGDRRDVFPFSTREYCGSNIVDRIQARRASSSCARCSTAWRFWDVRLSAAPAATSASKPFLGTIMARTGGLTPAKLVPFETAVPFVVRGMGGPNRASSMNYCQIRPSAAVGRYVEFYWMLEDKSPVSCVQGIIPDGRTTLILNFGSPFESLANCAWNTQPKCFFVGQITGPLLLRPSGTAGMLGVQ